MEADICNLSVAHLVDWITTLCLANCPDSVCRHDTQLKALNSRVNGSLSNGIYGHQCTFRLIFLASKEYFSNVSSSELVTAN